jgi:cell division initiation protein
MSYTPVELRHVHVARSLLGYKRDAVEALLADVADSFETVWRERGELADHLEVIEQEVERLRQREQALTHTLVAAEQAATHVKEQAKHEAELILAEAHNEARSVTRTAQGERQRLYAEARRIETLLRGALGMIEESVPDGESVGERPAGWPGREDTREFEQRAEAEPQEPTPLRRVSGGYGWADPPQA